MRAMLAWVRSRVEPPAPQVTDTKLGASGARRLMASQRLRSISSVLGGKNSNEIAGVSARRPSGAGAVTSVMAPRTPLHSGELKIGQCTLVLIAHHIWEIAHLHAKQTRNHRITYNRWARLMVPDSGSFDFRSDSKAI